MNQPHPTCAAVVLNYNGRPLLQENLPSVIAAAQRVDGGCEVIVLDNRSTDGSVEFVRGNYPGVIVEVAPASRVVFSYNGLLQRLRHKYVVLLNNDVRLREDTLSVLLPPCTAPDVFAVSAVLLNSDGTQRRRVLARTHRGLLRTASAEAKAAGPTLDAGGACTAFDREKFVALGGFDDLYWPYYWEDTDLSYVAWKRGFRVLVEPRSVAYHLHRGTIQSDEAGVIFNQNAHLFFWKNITDPAAVAKHIAWMPVLVPLRVVLFKWDYLRGLWRALRKLRPALRRRREMKPLWTRTDAEVWALANGDQQ